MPRVIRTGAVESELLPRVILNPEEEDAESCPPTPVPRVAEEPPVPPIIEPVDPWTEWATVPDRREISRAGDPSDPFTRTSPYNVKEWRFKFGRIDAPMGRLVIQVRLVGGDTETHIVPLEQLKQVTCTPRDYMGANYTVELDMNKYTGGKGAWNPGTISYNFTEEENALAFQEALVDFLAQA